MIDLAKYVGVDDSNFAIKLGMVDKLTHDKWDKCGPLVAITYCETSPEQRDNNRANILDIAGRIKAQIECDK